MGFGVVLVGFAILLFEILGFDFIGYATLAYGAYLIGQHFPIVKYSIAPAMIGCVCSAFRMLVRYSVIEVSDKGGEAIARLGVEVVIVLCYTAICLLFQIAVARFAHQNKAFSLERLANTTRYFTALYFVLRILMIVFTQTEFVSNFLVIVTVFQYIVLLLNIYFIYSCFASITTPRLLEREIESDIEFEEKEKEKKAKRKKIFNDDEE